MTTTNPGGADTPRSHAMAQALQLHAAGRLDEAAAAYADLLRDSPDDTEALTQLGVVRLQQQRLDDAGALFERVLTLDARAAAAHAWRGEALRRRGALQPAIASFHRALALQPRFAPALFNLGLAEADLGNRDAARDAWLKFDALRPADSRVHAELGRLAFAHADYAEAVRCFARQLERTPGDARALRLLAQALEAGGDRERALSIIEQAAAIDPSDAETAFRKGRILDRLARLEEAIDWFGRAATLAPHRADIHNAAAVAWDNLGEPAAALREYHAALTLDPGDHQAHSNLLLALHHVEPPDHAVLFDEHLRWAARHAGVERLPREAFPNDCDAGRTLCVGYLSPRFCAGPLEQFLLPLLAAHDRDRVRITCYATSDARDAVTDLMRSHTQDWRDVAQLTDEALVESVREDRIDILVDLVGHCPGNRLRALARRAAPVQITWLDYIDTTGLQAMDYLLTDAQHSPLDGAQRYVERLLRLPDTRFCYGPGRALPALRSAGSSRPLTFGCFNRLSKIGANVIAAWSRILLRVPHSRMTLKAAAFEAQSTCERTRDRFEAHGVARSRIDLRRFTSVQQMMQEYNDVDVVLDPFPYNAATTTCDALAMGVPSVTLAGETMAGRQGAAIMTAGGLPDWIARSPDEYVERAARAAEAGPRGATARNELRERFRASPLCDAPRFARALEVLYRKAWVRWCEGAPPADDEL